MVMISAPGWIVRLFKLVPHVEVVLVGFITGTVRINNKMYSVFMLSYSTLLPISVPQPIHSALAAEWITAWTDPSLSPPPSFHFSCADIYWSLSEKFPSSHPFPKVELQRKSSRVVCVCMRVIYKWGRTSFHFSSFPFFPLLVSVSLARPLTLNQFVLFIYFS